MNEASFASLSPTLLARKGGAKPAMRPQHGGMMSGGNISSLTANLDDLGWNDMGQEGDSSPEGTHEDPHGGAEVVQLTPAPLRSNAAADAQHLDEEADAGLEATASAKPAVVSQRESLAERLDSPKVAKAPARARRPAIERGKRAAFTLRLDAERHLKLRLACTIRNRSAQQIVTDALDAFMKNIPELESLAEQVKRPGTKSA